MTENADRDINPPSQPARADPPWELLLGNDLEQCYSYFAELHFVFLGGLPDRLIDELTVLRRWMGDRLRELGVPGLLVDAADHAVAGIRQWTHPSVFTDKALNRRRRSIRDTFELLQQITRSHVRPDRRRYYDLGVMLYRVNMCVILDRTAPGLPLEVHQAWPRLPQVYRRELWRSCATLVSFVRDEGDTNRPDPALRDLDAEFHALADYLEPRLAEMGPPDEELLERLHTTGYSAGLFTSAKIAMEHLRD
jgi:hypothetical protein